ncbi:DJ-1/PfpI family protein [Fulvivirga sp. 29W222]|uniref:DJ-1/PfpI family protein n=1 Tax=Fulvivirga marina TaxID=2494733 RepID=A0A937G161_9BACT|nr:DJ-1/PfpI family protein [Fulvivirga marina]MBL6446606.1 DJ-1/PfpI family protein [Fulvivirga marina]
MKVGILIFNEVEVLDFAGPFEVFSLTETLDRTKIFDVSLVGQTLQTIKARNGLQVVPNYNFESHPPYDIVIIPGGYGAVEIEINNVAVIEWITKQYNTTKILASVCTGAFLLAKAGLLKERKATTHWMDLYRLENDFQDIEVIRGAKFVDQGKIITSGGISAGINMSFHLIKRLFGAEIAKNTARRMEYSINI